ncbi:MAG: YgjV family protein [Butyricicoccus sp.]|nr:YgjV family protein [Butyricicoccus sp.]
MFRLIAQAIGFVGMSINVASYQCKANEKIIFWRMISEIVNLVHYLMMGAISGGATLIFSILNAYILNHRTKYRWAAWKGWRWTCSLLMCVTCILTWGTDFALIPSLCALTSMLTSMQAAWDGRSTVVRLTKLLVAGPTWIVYALIFGSYSGVLTEVIGMTSAAIGLYRHRTAKVKVSH